MKDKRIKQINLANLSIVFISLSLFILTIYASSTLYIDNVNENIEVVGIPTTIAITFEEVEEIELFHEEYEGIILSSDINSFSKIKFYLNEIKFEKENYPLLKEIVFYHKSKKTCNGYFTPDAYIVEVFHCFEDIEVRDSQISKENIELFTLAHELGHYYTLDQYEADEYAWSLLIKAKRVSR